LLEFDLINLGGTHPCIIFHKVFGDEYIILFKTLHNLAPLTLWEILIYSHEQTRMATCKLLKFTFNTLIMNITENGVKLSSCVWRAVERVAYPVD